MGTTRRKASPFSTRRKMKIRSWSKEFLNVEKFGVPKDVKEAVSRAQVNGAYYLGNYLCVVALLTLVQGFLNPILIIGLGLVGGLGFVVYTQGEKVKVGSVEVTQMQATIAIGGAVFYLTSGLVLLYSIVAGAVLALAHAAVRKPSIKSRATNKLNEAIDDLTE